MRRLLLAVLVTGFLLNLTGWALLYLTGWAGSVFELGSLWAKAGILARTMTVLEFVSGFVVALVWCLVYRLSSPSWGRSKMQLALVTAGIVWLGRVAVSLGLLNGGYLPPSIAIATTLLALATFVIVAPLLPQLLPDRVAPPT